MTNKLKVGSIVTVRKNHDYLGLSKHDAGELINVTEGSEGWTEVDVNFFHSDHDSIIMDAKEVKLIASATKEASVAELEEGDKIIGINTETGKLIASKVKAIQEVSEFDYETIIITEDFYLIVEDEDEAVTLAVK